MTQATYFYVSYEPTPPGSSSGPIVQAMRAARPVDASKLSRPIVRVDTWREDYGSAFHVVDGQVVAKPEVIGN